MSIPVNEKNEYKYDLSVIIPSIRVQNLEKIYFMLENAIQPYTWEMIVIGPYPLPFSKPNIKYYQDFGSPSRCVQIGSMLVESKYLMWMSDDATFIAPYSLGQCVEMFEEKHIDYRDAICLRYFEGEGNNEFEEKYWTARTHADQHLIGIMDDFKCAPLGMYRTAYFRSLGGLDTRYLHINMCTHDLAFRLQNAGGKVHLSPQTCARFYWSWPTSDAKPVQRAYFEVDRDLFKQEWDQDQTERINIDYWNHIQSELVWKMRFGE